MKLTPADAMPSLALLVVIIVAVLSGNDKAPFMVLFCLTGIFLYFLTMLARALLATAYRAANLRLAFFAALPLLYTAAVITLGHAGVLDTMYFLGFR